MSFRLLISSRAEKDLKKLDRSILVRIDRALLLLSVNPYLENSKHIQDKRLAQFRVRVGDYRILYDVYPKIRTVYVFRIGHRRDIYR